METIVSRRDASSYVHIGEAARQLNVTPTHLRILEAEGRIPPVRRDYGGRIYTPADIALLRALGVGKRPARLKTIEELAG